MEKVIITLIACFFLFLLDVVCAYVMLLGTCLIFDLSPPSAPATLALTSVLFLISGSVFAFKMKP